MKKTCVVGGIIKHKGKGGFGFKTSFSSVELAQKYKDMVFWIIKNDKICTSVERGYYDKKK